VVMEGNEEEKGVPPITKPLLQEFQDIIPKKDFGRPPAHERDRTLHRSCERCCSSK